MKSGFFIGLHHKFNEKKKQKLLNILEKFFKNLTEISIIISFIMNKVTLETF